jgi:hypothetical protein
MSSSRAVPSQRRGLVQEGVASAAPLVYAAGGSEVESLTVTVRRRFSRARD